MRLQAFQIHPTSNVSDIVKEDHRTASVFDKYGIEYCCGGKWPLSMVCETKGVPLPDIIEELSNAVRQVNLPHNLQYMEWELDFLTDFLVKVHHHYLQTTIPATHHLLTDFTSDHRKKYPFLEELMSTYETLGTELIPHLKSEEEIIFPYIRHVYHATKDNSGYGALLIKTMRKPLEWAMNKRSTFISILFKLRGLTDEYVAPANACVKHRVCYETLRDIDNDLAQYIYLKSNVLYPRAIAMEDELLSSFKNTML